MSRHIPTSERSAPAAPPSSRPKETSRVGLIAGWGNYPRQVAVTLRQAGHRVFCAGIRGHSHEALPDECHAFRSIGLTRLGALVGYFKKHGIDRVTMAGKIHKALLFQRGYFLRNLPDWRCFRAYFSHFVLCQQRTSDDSLLSVVVREFARSGIAMVPATDLVPDMLARDGLLGRIGLTQVQRLDIEFGWGVAKELGHFDIGQTVAVKRRAVLALEALEGTDECIRRAGRLCSAGGFTVVKVAKPQQDMRFDVPTIGLGTVQTLWQSGASALAIEAGRTIVLDPPAVARFADEHGIAVVAIRDGHLVAVLSAVA